MIKSEITHLYKYKPFNEFTLDIIANSKVYFPKPDTFNDPYDCDIKIDDNLSHEDYLKMIEIEGKNKGRSEEEIKAILNGERANKVPQELREHVRNGCREFCETNLNMGVLSLCEDYRNILMWSHYADEHRGICIEFERTNSNFLGDSDMTKPVKYLKSYPKIRAIDFMTPSSVSINQKMLWTKSNDWEYEREWRMISEIGNKIFPIPAKITSIIFGIRASQRSIDIIRKLTEKSGIKLKQAQKLTNEFGVKANKII